HIRQREQSLPYLLAVIENVTDCGDRIARFACFDPALAGAIDPNRIVVKVANDVPDLVGRLLEDRTIIAFRHGCPPPCSICSIWGFSRSRATRFLTHSFDTWNGNARHYHQQRRLHSKDPDQPPGKEERLDACHV